MNNTDNNKIRIILFPLLLVCFLASCTTMTKDDCSNANWKKYGYQSAMQGEDIKHLQNLNLQCSDYGIKANKKLYNKGRKLGLKKYCTYKNGEKLGRNQHAYKNICPKNLEKAFLKGYSIGELHYKLEQKEEEILHLKNKLKRKNIQHKIQSDRESEKKIFTPSNCAHITADGGCAHEL